jgi:HEAT repeat protein
MPLIRKGPHEPSVSAAANPDAFIALAHGTTEERWAAARSLATVPGGVDALGKALASESDARVREAIFTSLARAATVESAEAVLPYLRSDQADLRRAALDALKTMPGAVQPKLPELLADADADVRLLTCEIVLSIPSDESAQLLCNLLERESEVNVCAAAVGVLAEIGGADSLPVLSRCAARFASEPFLGFSIKAAADRIGAQPKPVRG